MAENPYQAPQVDLTPKLLTPTPAAAAVSGLTNVRLGLQFHYYGIVILLITGISAIVVMVMSIALSSANGDPTSMLAAGAFLLLAVAASLIAYVLMIIGHFLCLSAPVESRARGLIQISVVGLAFYLICAIGATYLSFTEQLARNNDELNSSATLLNLVGVGAGIIAFFTFLNFLKRIAQFVQSERDERHARRVINIFAVLLLLYLIGVIGLVIIMAPALQIGEASGVATIVIAMAGYLLTVLIVGLVAFCMYTTLLRGLIRVLSPENQSTITPPIT